MPLALTDVGKINTIKKISGPKPQIQRLQELGFVVGEDVAIVSKIAGNIIVSVKNSRIAISKEMAMRIMV